MGKTKEDSNQDYYWSHRESILSKQKKKRDSEKRKLELSRACWRRYYKRNSKEILQKQKERMDAKTTT